MILDIYLARILMYNWKQVIKAFDYFQCFLKLY